MKLCILFLLFLIIGVYAQQKVARPEQTESSVVTQRTRRGRTRYTTETVDIESTPRPTVPRRSNHNNNAARLRHESAKLESRTNYNVKQPHQERGKPEATKPAPSRHDRAKAESRQHDDVPKLPKQPNARLIDRRPATKTKKSYEVEELIDDIPNVHAANHHHQQKRTRVITETKFEAANAPKTKLFEPAPSTTSVSPDELLKTFGTIANDKPESAQAENKATTASSESEATEKKRPTSESPEEISAMIDDMLKIPTEALKEPTTKSTTTTTAAAAESSTTEDRQLLHARESSPIVEQDARKNFRTRSRAAAPKPEEPAPHVTRVRVRGRPTRIDEPQGDASSSRPVTRTRTIRRQHQEAAPAARNAPSVFTSDASETGTKSRAERRIAKPSDTEYDYLVPSNSRRHLTRTPPSEAATTRSPPRRGSRRGEADNNAANPQRARTSRGGETTSRSTGRKVGGHKETEQPINNQKEVNRVARPSSSRQQARTTPSVTTKRETIARASRRLSDSNEVENLVKSTSQKHITKTTPTGAAKVETTVKPVTRRGGVKYQFSEPQADNQIIDRAETKSRNRNDNKRHEVPLLRVRTRNPMADIDESKIEVLPLFETNSEPANIIGPKSETARTSATSETTKRTEIKSTTPLTAEKSVTRETTTVAESTRRTSTVTESTRRTSTSARGSTARKVTGRTTTEQPASKSRSTRRLKRRKSTPVPDELRAKTNVRRRQTSTEPIPTVSYTTTDKAKAIERRQTQSVDKHTTPSIVIRSTPNVRETVKVTESEVITTRRVTKSQLQKGHEENSIQNAVKAEEPLVTQVVARGHKKDLPDVKKSKEPNSEEDIDDEDNYPEPFKALIQEKKAKNGNHEKSSRTRSSSTTTKPLLLAKSSGTVKVTTTKPTTTSTNYVRDSTLSADRTSEKVIEELNNNELLPTAKPSTTTNSRPSRKRFSLTTKEPVPTDKSSNNEKRFDRSTKRPNYKKKPSTGVSMITEIVTEKSSSSSVTKIQKYHARFNSGHKSTSGSTKSTKAPHATTSSRKLFKPSKIDHHERSHVKTVKVLESSVHVPSFAPIVKKSNNRFSARYRGDIVNRVATRTTTGSPVYVPTVPTVTPSPTSVNPSVELEDNNTLGVHIISFDDIVNNTIQSDNLINGEQSSSTTHPSTVVSSEAVSISTPSDVGNHDKQMSIIERIISSITSISTTPTPNDDYKTATTTLKSEPTRASAILKLATKKSNSPLEKTQQQQTTQTLTTEKPTTIIERILTSLSAIQAETTTETNSKGSQVGSNNFNSISTTTFRPSSTKRSVTKEATVISTLPAQVTSTLDPLTLLEQIKSDQTLQKRTIEKLLFLLNVANDSPTTLKTVLVTPKVNTFVQTSAKPIESLENVTPIPTETINLSELIGRMGIGNENVLTTTSTTTTEATTTTTTAATTPTPAPQTNPPVTSTAPPPTTTTTPPTTTTTTQAPTTTIPVAPSTEPSVSPMATTANPKDDVETFVPTTIPVVSTRIQDMLNMLSKLIKEMDRSTTTTTESPTMSTMNPEMLAGRIGEINTEQMPTVTAGDVTIPVGMTNVTSEVEDLNMSVVNNGTTPMPTDATTIVPMTSNDTQMMDDMNAKMMETTSAGNDVTTTTEAPVTVTPRDFIAVSTPIVATAIRYTTTPIDTEPDDTDAPSTLSPDFTLDTTLSPSTLPAIEKIDISPDKVSVYSANDIASTFNDELFGTTVSILAKNFVTTIRNEIMATTTTEAPPPNVNSSANSSVEMSANVQTAAENGTMPEAMMKSNEAANAAAGEGMMNVSAEVSAAALAMGNNGTMASETTANGTMSTESVAAEMTTVSAQSNTDNNNATIKPIESNTIDTTKGDESSNSNNTTTTTTIMSTNNNTETIANVTTENRGGRLLDVVQDPVANDIQSTPKPKDKDYFIFAILPNNTILRKKPSMFPTKETPFLIVGYYPNNTIIRKFPNGTLVPEEPVIQVSGFDTRDPIPPLPDITSNQVTQTQAEQAENNILQTVNLPQNIQVESNEVVTSSLTSTSTPTTTSSSTTTTENTPSATTITTTATELTTTTSTTPSTTTQSPQVETLEVEPLTSTQSPAEDTDIDNNVITGSSKPSSTPELLARFAETTTATPTTTNDISTTLPPNATNTIPVTTPPNTMATDQPVVASTIGITNIKNIKQMISTVEAPMTVMTTTTTEAATIEEQTITTNPPTTTVAAQPRTVTTKAPVATITATTTPMPATTTRTTPQPVTTEKPTPIRLMETTITTPSKPTLRSTGSSTTFLPTFISTILSTMRPFVTTTLPPPTYFTVLPTTITTPPPTTTTPPPTTTTTNPPTTTTKPSTTTTTTQAPTTTQPPPPPPTTTTTQLPPTIRATMPPTTTIIVQRYTATPTTTSRPQRSTTSVPQLRQRQTIAPTTTPDFRTTLVADIDDLTTIVRNNNRGRSRFQTTTPIQTTVTTELPTTTPYFVTTTTATALRASTPVENTLAITPKKKQLTEEQRRDLETLAALEREQQAILKQLAFLTNLNLGPPKQPTKQQAPSQSDLANRIIALAVERNNKPPIGVGAPATSTVTTTPPPTTINLLESLAPSTSKETNNLVTPSGNKPSYNALLQELSKYDLNSITPSTLTSTYGKSNEAILAALLKQQGLGPTTPDSLGEKLKPLVDAATTTPRPRPRPTTPRPRTTQPVGRLRQGLNWLLNALAPPPPQPRPRPRPRPQPVVKAEEVELLNNEPTNITPVFDNTLSASTKDKQSAINSINSLTDAEFQRLLVQLEAAQKDPKKLKNIDLGFIKNANNNNKNVEVSNLGTSGASTKIVPPNNGRGRIVKSTTTIPISTNSIAYEDDIETTTATKAQIRLPPVKLAPVPGIPEEGGQVRGQLINAAVNVTKAISSFLGSAIQDASQQFFRMFSDSASAQQLTEYLNATLFTTNTTNL